MVRSIHSASAIICERLVICEMVGCSKCGNQASYQVSFSRLQWDDVLHKSIVDKYSRRQRTLIIPTEHSKRWSLKTCHLSVTLSQELFRISLRAKNRQTASFNSATKHFSGDVACHKTVICEGSLLFIIFTCNSALRFDVKCRQPNDEAEMLMRQRRSVIVGKPGGSNKLSAGEKHKLLA